jgi:hypothetical protein
MFLTAVTFFAMAQQVNVTLGELPTETCEMLKIVYYDEALSHSIVFEWFK